jgi:hypothetical protein
MRIFTPTPNRRRRVRLAAHEGQPDQVIARRLRITVRTLRKHFERELEDGRTPRSPEEARLMVLNALFNAAMRGNVSAMKAWLRLAPPRPKPHLVRHD